MSNRQSPDPIALATDIQRRAADPAHSAVLRASAGSGKTKVLVDRILRLALVGAPLKSIVALTFTRKAAIEIKQRLLEEIRKLAIASADERSRNLESLLGNPPDAHVQQHAALLFSEILEDANGLLIGTIHTFCQTMLSRFADYAGLEPSFTILENTDQLWNETLQLLERQYGPDAETGSRLNKLASGPVAIRKKLDELLNTRLYLDRWSARVAKATGQPHVPGRVFVLYPVMMQDLAATMFNGTLLSGRGEPNTATLIKMLVAETRELSASGFPELELLAINDDKIQGKLNTLRDKLLQAAEDLDAAPGSGEAIDNFFLVFLTKEKTVRKIGLKGEAYESLQSDLAPLLELHRMLTLAKLYESNGVLLEFGLKALDIFDALKKRDRCLDFHDLEYLAWRLIHDQDIGPWILYRMDQRLDHLLIDEFQDTNLNQWEILESFQNEFLASQADPPRTVFYVGDVKQSIYGFRGARPEIFSQVAGQLTDLTGRETLTLPTNFRSSRAVVENVARAFQGDTLSGLLPSQEEVEASRQHCSRGVEGRVSVLPLLPADPDTGLSAHQVAAKTCADVIQEIVSSQTIRIDKDKSRPARYGDIMILSRSRTHIAAYEDALREAAIPFIPAGRGALAQSREVKDILALLHWLTYPNDDVSLATVLRSPLLRQTETQVHSLLFAAATSGLSLWRLLSIGSGLSDRPGFVTLLNRWLGANRTLNAHDLLRLVYRSCGALESYADRRGEQASFNLQRLFDLALAHDQRPFSTRRGFIEKIHRAALQGDEEEATLPETDTGRVRILTIHGAKGLEAPFVILADAGAEIRSKDKQLVLDTDIGDGPLISLLRQEHLSTFDVLSPDPLSSIGRAATSRTDREEANLLYVAMTRARDAFHAIGAKTTKGDPKPSHHAWLQAADLACEDTWRCGDHTGNEAPAPNETCAIEPLIWTPGDLSPLIHMRFPSREVVGHVSDRPDGEVMDTEDGLESMDRTAAQQRGVRIHRLLELTVQSGGLPAGDGPEHQEVAAVLANPDLAWVFDAKSRGYCEAPIMHQPADDPDARVLGVIDRLLIDECEIRIVDYKTNRTGLDDLPSLCELYRPQMHAYAAALRDIYPARKVRAFLLFTSPGGTGGCGVLKELMEI